MGTADIGSDLYRYDVQAQQSAGVAVFAGKPATLLPLVVLLSYRSGKIWVNDISLITAKTEASVNAVRSHLLQYIYGSITLALVLSLVTGLATFTTLKLIKLVKQEVLARRLKRAV